jgi:hypothetical protein
MYALQQQCPQCWASVLTYCLFPAPFQLARVVKSRMEISSGSTGVPQRPPRDRFVSPAALRHVRQRHPSRGEGPEREVPDARRCCHARGRRNGSARPDGPRAGAKLSPDTGRREARRRMAPRGVSEYPRSVLRKTGRSAGSDGRAAPVTVTGAPPNRPGAESRAQRQDTSPDRSPPASTVTASVPHPNDTHRDGPLP